VLDGLAVRVSQHQNLLGFGVLNNHGDEPVAFFEIKVVN
jgi:hypothetical protein